MRYKQARLIETVRLDGKDTRTLMASNLDGLRLDGGMVVVTSRRGQTLHVPLQNVAWLEPEEGTTSVVVGVLGPEEGKAPKKKA